MRSPLLLLGSALLLSQQLSFVLANSQCQEGDASCDWSSSTKSSCEYWCKAENCPSGYPKTNADDWDYCWGLKCNINCQ